MNRNELVIRASAVGLDPTTYANDSKLEQKVLWLEKRGTTFSGTLATGTLTDATTQPADGDTVVLGATTYTWKTALTEAFATSTLTSNGTAPTDGDSVTVDGKTYVFRTALTNSGTTPYEVFINTTAAAALVNLKKAINLTGVAGTDYGTNTQVHPTVAAGAITSTTLVVTALVLGTAANNILTSTINAGTLSWTGTSLAGGADPVVNQVLRGAAVTNGMTNLKNAINGGTGLGTTYSTGTAAHSQVTATSTATTVVVTAVDYSVTNADVATTVTGANATWGGTTLSGGVKKQIALNTTTYSGANGLSGDKDV